MCRGGPKLRGALSSRLFTLGTHPALEKVCPCLCKHAQGKRRQFFDGATGLHHGRKSLPFCTIMQVWRRRKVGEYCPFSHPFVASSSCTCLGGSYFSPGGRTPPRGIWLSSNINNRQVQRVSYSVYLLASVDFLWTFSSCLLLMLIFCLRSFIFLVTPCSQFFSGKSGVSDTGSSLCTLPWTSVDSWLDHLPKGLILQMLLILDSSVYTVRDDQS